MVTAYPVVTPTNNVSFRTPSTRLYALTRAGVVTCNGVSMANTAGTSVLTSTPTPNLVYRQSASTKAWASWNGTRWVACAAPPVYPGRPKIALSAPKPTSMTLTITEPTDGNAVAGYHVMWRKTGATTGWILVA